MKSKKVKGHSNSPHSSEEDATHRNAFSFLKNRFFSGNHHSNLQHQQERTSSPSPSTTSTQSKPWSIENTKSEEKALSRSFDEQSISEFNTSSSSSSIANTPRLTNKNARQLSMMGIDSLLNQQNITELPETIQVAEPTTNAFIPARRNSTTATEVSSHKKSMNKLSLDLQHANYNNLEFVNKSTIAEKRTSLIILKEGYLFKKTDFKPFHKQNKLDRGWKLYRVILRGHKLYLYKVTSESPLRSLFPSSSHHQQQLKQLHSNNSLSSRQSLTFSLSSSSIASTNTTNMIPSATLKLMRSDFDREAQLIFSQPGPAAQGAVFMELNQVSLEPKQQVYLVIFNDLLYTCIRPDSMASLWTIEQSIPIAQLKLEYMREMTPTSPISINSMQSDSYSNGPLLFNILHDSTVLGVYSTQFCDLGQSWIHTFQNVDNTRNQMCDATQQCHPGIIYRDDHSVQGGTIHALVQELLLNDDPTFLNVFLLTYTLFTTGSRVLAEIKSWAVKPEADESRILDVFTIWCKEFSLDVMGDVATGMMEILGLLSSDKAATIKELVLKTVNENVEKTCESKSHVLATIPDDEDEEENLVDPSIENISAYRVDGKRRDSINLSNLLITGLTPAVFLQIDPLSFAKQICLFHYTKQKQFYKELLNPLSYLPRPQLSVQMLNSLLFTTITPHFLTKIIRNQILIDSQQEDEDALLVRSKLLEHWIQVGLDLFDLGDMTGWCAIAMGVCSVGVIRLRETWKAVDRDLVNRVQTEWVDTLVEYDMFTQDMWAEEWGEAPAAKALVDSTKRIPFFGAVRQYADRYRKHSKKHLSPNMIHFEECQNLYNAITTSLSVFDSNTYFEAIDVVGVDPLQSFFEHSVTDMMSVPHDYKYLQECSLACEPRIFGQGRRTSNSMSKPPQGDITPPSQSCLTFPAILDNCSLFNNKTTETTQSETMKATTISTRKTTRRRTLSFPPSNNQHFASATRLNLLEGSFISNRHHRTYSAKSLREAHKKNRDAVYGPDGDILFTVQQEDLVLKASALLLNDTKKTGSFHSIEFLKKEEKEEEDALVVSVKAGYLEQLVDSLVYSISPYEEQLKEQWHMFTIANGLKYQHRPDKVIMDEEEYIHVFFMTYRTFCSSANLLDMLRRRFMDAQYKCKPAMRRKSSLSLLESYFTPDASEPDHPESCDWKKLADIQLRVMNLILYWIEEYPYDFIDEVQITRYMSNFLKNARTSVASWRILLVQPEDAEALSTSNIIEEKIAQIRDRFVRKSMCPCYDMKTTIGFEVGVARGADDVYRQLTSGTQQFHTTLQVASANRSVPLSISSRPRDTGEKSVVDTFAPEVLLEQVDQNVRQFFSAVTMQDWIQTFDVFETQVQDIYAWLPARKPSRTSRMPMALSPVVDGPSSHVTDYHLLPEEIVVSDIFFAIQNARRSVVAPSAFSDDDLILAFPGSIQYLYYMHFIIRSWVIHEIAAADIDSKTRVLRIEKFLQVVLLSKMASERLELFPELKEQLKGEGRVPGFVEYAIASALVSPEVRLFTKAWHDVAMQHGHANLDHLEHLLQQIQKMQSHVRQTNKQLSNSTSFRSIVSQLEQCQYLVPSLGWLFERIIELGTNIPDTFENKEGLMNMDKRRYIHYLLQLMMNVQLDLDEQNKEKKGISMSFLLSPHTKRTTWKELRELSIRESKKAMGSSSSLVLRGAGQKIARNPIFSKLVTEQTDKLKRDFKEKDRIDKDWLNFQQKLQKKQIEQAKQTEKQDKKGQLQSSHNLSHLQQPYNVMPRINSFLRGLRPQSMVTTPIQHIFPFDQPHLQTHNSLSTMKASTVINLIHSTTSVASTYTKREYVFRIVTEEGAQYLFQAMSREDMNDWMQQINTSAREGAAKRQSVLVNETMDSQSMSPVMDRSTNRRMSVYGVGLDELMPDGHMPVIVDKCIREIEKRGLEEVGIYRVAGTGSVVSALKAAFNKDVHGVNLSAPQWADINVVADAFKQFLRELPEPLLTYSYYDEFITASASEDHDQRIYLLKKVLNKLPFSNYTLLKRIVEHFVNVTDFEATNHMYATNLAIVFGPTLLQPSPGPTSFATTMSNLGHHQNVVKYLILNYHYLFDVESDEMEPSKEDQK